MQTIIFDLDGTLADTSGDLIAAANACFKRLGHGELLDPGRDQATAFRGGRAMLGLGFSRLGREAAQTEIDAQYPRLLEHYAENIDTFSRLYPGVVAMLERLIAEGRSLGVCTNKPEGLADTLLRRLNVKQYFGALIGADTLSVRKPDPAPLLECVRRLGGSAESSVLIGDTANDRETGANAGVRCILVTFGPDGRDVAHLTPEGLLDHFDDLPDVLTRVAARPLGAGGQHGHTV